MNLTCWGIQITGTNCQMHPECFPQLPGILYSDNYDVWIFLIFFIHLSADDHSGCFHVFLSLFMRNASVVFVQGFLETYNSFLHWWMQRSRNLGSQGSSTVNILKPYQGGFQSPSTILHLHQQYGKVLVLATSLPTFDIVCLFPFLCTKIVIFAWCSDIHLQSQHSGGRSRWVFVSSRLTYST